MKIFGIGLSKTGTTSLASALQLLGFRTRDNMGIDEYRVGDVTCLDLEVVDAHDALTDTPIPSFYRELDVRYPNSKFILTVRDREAWLQSCRKQFTQKLADKNNEAHRRLFFDLYGTDVFDADRFARGYDCFVEGAKAYFRGRPGDLLVLDIAAGGGWSELCPFLGAPQPDVPFPKANVTRLEWIDQTDIVGVARRAGAELLRLRSPGPRGLLHRAKLTLGGGNGASSARATARRLVVAGLKTLAPDVPVVCAGDEPTAHDNRRHWNHFWLVDPLDGEREYREGGRAFTIDIALIQDGRPICGVVYEPVDDVAILGRVGKAVTRCKGGERPLAIGDAQDRRWASSLPLPPIDLQADGSVALALCSLVQQGNEARSVEQPIREWHLAAAHAVLNSAGLRLVRHDDGKEISYSAPTFPAGPFKLQPAG